MRRKTLKRIYRRSTVRMKSRDMVFTFGVYAYLAGFWTFLLILNI